MSDSRSLGLEQDISNLDVNQEHEKKEESPLYSLLPAEAFYLSPGESKIDPNIFRVAVSNTVIEEKSLELLRRGPISQRYAVVGIIKKVAVQDDATNLEEADIKPQLVLYFRPGFESGAKPEKLKEAAEQFTENEKKEILENKLSGTTKSKKKINYERYFVQAIKGKPGVVHAKVISKILNNHRELEDPNHPWHIDPTKAFTLGFSVHKRNGALEWINRSTKNRRIFSKNSLALACFAFSEKRLEPNSRRKLSYLNNIDYDHYFNLDRSIPIEPFVNITDTATGIINQCLKDSLSSIVDTKQCYSASSEKIWRDICILNTSEKQLKIQTLLINNFFIYLLGYGSSKYRDQTEQLLLEGVREANKQNLTIDLDYTPPGFNKNIIAFAAENGNLNVVTFFIDQATPEKKPHYWKMAFVEAAKHGHVELAVHLLEHPVIEKGNEAKAHKELDDIKTALEFWNLYDFSAVRKKSFTSPYQKLMFEMYLLSSSKWGSVDILSSFIDVIDEDLKKRILKIAIQFNQTDIISLLLTPDKETKNSESLDKNLLDYAFRTACEMGTPEIVQLLLKTGANIESNDEHGNTPLMNAVELGNSEMVKVLLNNNANVNAVNQKGETPLIVSSISGNVEIAKELLSKNPNLEAKDSEGQTALFKALDHNHHEIAQMLILRKAKIIVNDKNGHTTLDMAFLKKELYIIQFGLIELLNKQNIDNFNFREAKTFIQNQNPQNYTQFMNSIISMCSSKCEILDVFFQIPSMVQAIFTTVSPSIVLNVCKKMISEAWQRKKVNWLIQAIKVLDDYSFLKMAITEHDSEAALWVYRLKVVSIIQSPERSKYLEILSIFKILMENKLIPPEKIPKIINMQIGDESLIQIALQENDREALQLLVKNNADLTILWKEDSEEKTPLDYAKEKLSKDQYLLLEHDLGIHKPPVKIDTEFVKMLISTEAKTSQLDLPDKINYSELKQAFLNYAKGIEPSKLPPLMQAIREKRNMLGIVLQNEPKMTSFLSQPSTLKQIAESVEELVNPPCNHQKTQDPK